MLPSMRGWEQENFQNRIFQEVLLHWWSYIDSIKLQTLFLYLRKCQFERKVWYNSHANGIVLKKNFYNSYNSKILWGDTLDVGYFDLVFTFPNQHLQCACAVQGGSLCGQFRAHLITLKQIQKKYFLLKTLERGI